jgi:N-acetylneuraminate lyase
MKLTLTGLVAAPHTPFRADGALDLDTIPRIAALLAHNGVSGAFICGTTGEGSSLSVAERKEVATAWRRSAPKGLKLAVHVGHLCLAESCALAAHAQEIGADAVATIAPSFFKPAGEAELVEWCRRIAAAAPSLPFYYYHMPAMTGVNIPAADFLQRARDVIPNLAGVKFTHEDLMDYGNAGEVDGGRYGMLFGRDEILLAGLSLGAVGAVGSTYNYAAPLYLRLIAAFERGDLAAARRAQTQAREFISVVGRYGGLAAGKLAMKLVGVDCGPVRLPLRHPSSEQERSLRQGLERIGFFDYCSRRS